MAANPLMAQRLQQMGRTALAKSAPAPLLRLLGGVGNVNFTPDTGGSVAGFSGKAAPGAFAGVNVGDPNTIQVMDQAGFTKPGQTGQLAVHEATHIMQNNLPPKVAARIPADNPTDPYNFGGEQGLVAARKAGQTLLDKPREQQAAIMQYYTAQNEGYRNKVAAGTATPADHQAAQQREQVYSPWINDLNHAPQSVIMPTDPNAQGNTINTKVRPVPGPATDIPGATMYATQVYKPGQAAPGTKPVEDIFDQITAPAGDIFDQIAPSSDPNTQPPVNSSVPIPAGLQGPPASAQPLSMSQRLASAAGDVITGMGKGVASTLSNIDSGANRLGNKIAPGFGDFMSPPNKVAALKQDAQTHGTAQAIGKGVEQAGEFMIPGSLEDRLAAKAAEVIPTAARVATPFVKMGISALTQGTVNKAQGGTFKAGAASGAIGSGIGQAAKAAAPAIAETALGIRGTDRGFGRTPGQAILEDTHGWKPSVVENSARNKSAQLTNELEQKVAGAPLVNMQPAIDVADQNIAKYQARNSPVANSVQALKDQITKNRTTGLNLAPTQTATGALNLKRGIGEAVGSWPIEQQKGVKGVARNIYGAIDNQLDQAAPGTAQLNQRISSLIPVANRAQAADLNAGAIQQALGKFARPTGALTGAITGGVEGAKVGGIPGAIGGVVGGLGIPALITSPTAQMATARAANSDLFRRLFVVPAGGAALQFTR